MNNSALQQNQKKIDSFILAGVVLGIFMFVLHCFINPSDDDFYFMAQSQTESLFPWLAMRYGVWSSRIVIEAVLWTVAKSYFIWKLLDVALVILLYNFLVKIFVTDKRDGKVYWVVALGILVYPFFHMESAGYMATTVNYLWPLVLATVACYGMKKSFLREKIRIWEYPIYIGSLIYASNLEAMNVFLLGIAAVLIGLCIVQKRMNYYLLSQLLIVVLMLIFILTCPGNAIRQSIEIEKWYPGFDALGLFCKMQLGYTSSLAHFIAGPNTVFPVFCFVLYLAVHLRYQKKSYRITAAVPFLCHVLSTVVNAFSSYDPSLSVWAISLLKIRSGVVLITSDNFRNILNYIPLLVYSICMFCVLASIYLCFKRTKLKAWFFVAFIVLGFASRAIMGFSPTIWDSFFRTFIIFYFVFIVCIIVIYQELRRAKHKHKLMIVWALCCLGAISYICTFAYRFFIV